MKIFLIDWAELYIEIIYLMNNWRIRFHNKQ